MASAAETGGRQESIQALRAVAALMVVLFHSGGAIAAPKYQHSDLVGSLTYGFDIGVDLFFVISGFVISLPLFLGRPKYPYRFLVARLSRVYPMAVLTCAIFITASIYIMKARPEPLLPVTLSSALLVPAPWQPIPFIFWTLKHELLFYALFSIVYIDKRVGLGIIITWAVASFVIASEDWLVGWFFHPQHIQFGFGIGAGALFCRGRISSRAAPIVLVLASVTFLVEAFAEDHLHTDLRRQALICGLSGMAIVYSAACIDMRSTLVSLLGDASYSIYLIHWFIVSAVNKAMCYLAVPSLISLMIVFLAATSGGALYYLMFERQIERWRKAIFSASEKNKNAPNTVPAVS